MRDTQNVLYERYTLYEKSLRGGLGLYYASNSVERDEWRLYVQALDVERNLPGISGVGYIDYVYAKDMQAYLEAVRADDAEGFTNYPDTFYPDKFLIKFIEPIEKNRSALGLDIGFEANRRAAAERARDLGVPALTKKIELVQDDKKQPGFLLLLPVYDTKNTPKTIEKRRGHFQGWVYAPFIGANFLQGLTNISKNQLNFSVYDGNKISPDTLIHSNVQYLEPSALTQKTQIKIAGRTWSILWSANESYVSPANKNMSLVIAGLGFLISISLFILLNHLVNSAELIAREVQKRTNELKEALDFQDLITNTIPDLIFVKDSEFRIVEANEAFLNIYSEDVRSSVIGSTTFEKFNPEEAEIFLKHDKIALEDGYSETEEQVTLHGGSVRTLFTTKVRFTNHEGENFILGIARDITEAKKAEANILRANDELARSNHELERFAYIASHDLQEPLRKIGGFTERLEAKLGDQLDEQSQTYMGFITGGVERMRELIQGLLAYSRISTDKSNIQKLNTNEIVELAIDNLSESISETNTTVNYKDLPNVPYDKVMLTQLFQNLISNAIKYKSDADPVVNIKAEDTGEFWEFSVHDNGMGMEAKYLDRIFEMFQRLHRKEDISGTGIGLSLCQKIVERYGGKIWVTSEPRKGSVFSFTVAKNMDEQQV